MSTEIIQRNYQFLNKLGRAKSIKARHIILAKATTEELLSIVEICVNILKFRVNLTKRQKQKLAKYADYLRKLARVRTENSARGVLQRGEGSLFPALILPILTKFKN